MAGKGKYGPRIKLKDPVRRAAILEAVRIGAPWYDAFAAAGINYQTFYNWRDKVESGTCEEEEIVDFFEEIKKAESDGVLELVKNIRETGLKRTWQASAFLLNHKRRKEFGFNKKDDEEDKQVVVNINLDPDQDLKSDNFFDEDGDSEK